MSRATARRIAKLEAMSDAGGLLAVWCWDQEEFEPEIARMIQAGELRNDERPRCVPWWEYRGPVGGRTHEDWIVSGELDR